MTGLPKPTIIELSQWQKEYYTLRSPAMTKDEYINKRKRDWYRYQYHKQFNK
jgi:hypothetical protein